RVAGGHTLVVRPVARLRSRDDVHAAAVEPFGWRAAVVGDVGGVLDAWVLLGVGVDQAVADAALDAILVVLRIEPRTVGRRRVAVEPAARGVAADAVVAGAGEVRVGDRQA